VKLAQNALVPVKSKSQVVAGKNYTVVYTTTDDKEAAQSLTVVFYQNLSGLINITSVVVTEAEKEVDEKEEDADEKEKDADEKEEEGEKGKKNVCSGCWTDFTAIKEGDEATKEDWDYFLTLKV